MGPIDVYLVSQFEEENGAGQSARFPIASSSGSTKHTAAEVVTVETTGKENEPQVQAQQAHQMCSDINTSQEFVGGMMKIVPSDVDVFLAKSYSQVEIDVVHHEFAMHFRTCI